MSSETLDRLISREHLHREEYRPCSFLATYHHPNSRIIQVRINGVRTWGLEDEVLIWGDSSR